jgi:hypothetical protein
LKRHLTSPKLRAASSTVSIVLASWARYLGFPDDVEIFPKQDNVSADGGGSNLWMSFFGYHCNGKFPPQVMIDEKGPFVTLEELLNAAEKSAVTEQELLALEIKDGGKKDDGKGTGKDDAKGDKKKDKPRYGTVEWGLAIVEASCTATRAARPGKLNKTVVSKCYVPGRIVGGGLLDEDETWKALSDAIRRNPHHDQKMLKDGCRIFGNGKADPFDFENAGCQLEDAVALDFAKTHADTIRYIAESGQWMMWNGACWQHERTLSAFDESRKLCRDAGDAKARTVAAVVTLARTDRQLAATIGQWDREPMLFNDSRGTIDTSLPQLHAAGVAERRVAGAGYRAQSQRRLLRRAGHARTVDR